MNTCVYKTECTTNIQAYNFSDFVNMLTFISPILDDGSPIKISFLCVVDVYSERIDLSKS